MNCDSGRYAICRMGVILMRPSGAEKVVRAAICNWPMTLRLCLVVSVVAATPTIAVCLVGPSVLGLFMR